MRMRVVCGGVVFAGMTALLTSQVLSQDQGGEQGGDSAMWAEAMKYAQPGAFHDHLKPMAGQWDLAVRMRMAPDAPWAESASTSSVKWIMGGRFLLEEVRGDAGGMPFEGMGMLGYDNFKKKYVSTWLDNMGTAIMISYGTCDASGKVFTLMGTHDNVFTGKKNDKAKSVTRIVNQDKQVVEMWGTGPDGRMFKTMEIT
ncbi:MAG: DUF1579 domain-containing protein, partial [Phycisphaerae bacterium]